MKMMKKALAAITVLCILMTVLSGCFIKINKNDTESTTETAADTMAAPVKTTVPPQTTAAASGLTDVKVGKTVDFGQYEQENNMANGKEAIVWRVLAVKDEKALLLTDKLLDVKPYNIENKDITWETSTLRKWLNEDFLNNAFTAGEQAAIAATTLLNKDNDDDWTDGGNNTNDKVFLLSREEAEMYLASVSARIAQGTIWAQNNFMGVAGDIPPDNMQWWLRSVGYKQNAACMVFEDGTISDGSLTFGLSNVSIESIGVRPALWVNL